MFADPRGPIEQLFWGGFVVAGRQHAQTPAGEVGAGKDIRLVGLDVTPWQERKGHKLKKSMIAGVYGLGIEVLVIGAGVDGRIECPDKVKNAVRENGIATLIVQPTAEACRTYNDFYHQGRRVALLAHGTC